LNSFAFRRDATHAMMITAMSTISTPVEQNVILHNVTWETYDWILNEHPNQTGIHFIYDDGELEIMVLSNEHEFPNRILADLVFALGVGLGIRVTPIGSTTHKRKALRKGFEPDSGFYVAKAVEMEAAGLIPEDPETLPPADLIIEVDVTSPSLPRMPIYRAFGIPEIWPYKDDRVFFYRLEQGGYVESASSLAFPPLTAELATKFVADRIRLGNIAWANQVLDWARVQ
jgi:Uma2 family endonuclease